MVMNSVLLPCFMAAHAHIDLAFSKKLTCKSIHRRNTTRYSICDFAHRSGKQTPADALSSPPKLADAPNTEREKRKIAYLSPHTITQQPRLDRAPAPIQTSATSPPARPPLHRRPRRPAKITQASTLYKSKEKTFSLMQCWEILHHHPKWNDRLSQKKQKAHVDPLVRPSASTNSSEFHCSPDINTSDPLVRPSGKKVEKAKRARGNTSLCSSESSPVDIALNNMWSEKKEMSAQSREERNDRLDEVISLEKERLKVEKRKLDLETNEREKRIMNMDLTTMDGPRKAYYLRLQQEIISRHMD